VRRLCARFDGFGASERWYDMKVRAGTTAWGGVSPHRRRAASHRLDVTEDHRRNQWMHWKTETLAFAFAVAALSGHATASRGEDSTDPSRFTYARLYCGPDGNTRFQDMTAELRTTDFAPPAPPVHIGSDFPAARAFFGGFDASWGAHDLENRLNHPGSGPVSVVLVAAQP